jgi:hypothetical protein
MNLWVIQTVIRIVATYGAEETWTLREAEENALRI